MFEVKRSSSVCVFVFVCVPLREVLLQPDVHVNKTNPIIRPTSNQCLVTYIDDDIDDYGSNRGYKYDKVFLVFNTHTQIGEMLAH